MKTTKILLFVILFLCLFTVGALIYGFTPQSTDSLREVVKQFKPGSSWKLQSDDYHAPMLFCLQGHCDEAYISWSTSTKLTREQLSKTLADSGWSNFKIDHDCIVHENISGASQTLCSANGMVNSRRVIVEVREGKDGNMGGEVQLIVDQSS